MDKKLLSVFLVIMFAITLSSHTSKAEQIHCGLKVVTIKNGKVDKIRHGDGTVTDGGSYWSYDGKSITHSIMKKPIACGTKPRSREEIIEKLSSRFTENPNLHGLDRLEGQQMTNYTANLMRTDSNCHLLVDGSKSTQRKGMFYIDCNDKSGASHRYWVTSNDLKEDQLKAPATPISKAAAIEVCNQKLHSISGKMGVNTTTYKPALITGSTSRIIEMNGRNVVEIDFSAKNGIGVKNKYRGKCILESGRLIDVKFSPL